MAAMATIATMYHGHDWSRLRGRHYVSKHMPPTRTIMRVKAGRACLTWVWTRAQADGNARIINICFGAVVLAQMPAKSKA
eukprot:7880603-Alexandrium_andersonii.AAC.1